MKKEISGPSSLEKTQVFIPFDKEHAESLRWFLGLFPDVGGPFWYASSDTGTTH